MMYTEVNWSLLLEYHPVCNVIRQVSREQGIRVHLIGGYVRDRLLGIPVENMDFVVEGDGVKFARDVAALLRPRSKVTVHRNFGTAQFTYAGHLYEFVGARRESYRRNSRNPTVEPATLEEDRARRDFTINTISVSLNAEDFGTVYDPFGGIDDLKKKILRTPLDPLKTYDDDPLRMMRAIRFATVLGFTIIESNLEAIRTLAERINIVAPERIADELHKMLMAKKPSKAFYLMDHTHLLQHILPEVMALKGREVIEQYGHKDVFEHTMQVLDKVAEMSENIWLRWAALLHDIGKPVTKRFYPEKGWTFYGHEVVGARIAEKIFRRLKMPLNEKLNYVLKLIQLHLRPISLVEEHITDSALRRLLFEAGEELEDLLLLCKADITSKNEKKVKTFLRNFEELQKRLYEVEEKDRLRNWQPPINGELIMETFGLPPCKEVGMIKTAIREAILDGVIENTFDAAYRYMIEYARGIGLEPVRKS